MSIHDGEPGTLPPTGHPSGRSTVAGTRVPNCVAGIPASAPALRRP